MPKNGKLTKNQVKIISTITERHVISEQNICNQLGLDESIVKEELAPLIESGFVVVDEFNKSMEYGQRNIEKYYTILPTFD